MPCDNTNMMAQKKFAEWQPFCNDVIRKMKKYTIRGGIHCLFKHGDFLLMNKIFINPSSFRGIWALKILDRLKIWAKTFCFMLYQKSITHDTHFGSESRHYGMEYQGQMGFENLSFVE